MSVGLTAFGPYAVLLPNGFRRVLPADSRPFRLRKRLADRLAPVSGGFRHAVTAAEKQLTALRTLNRSGPARKSASLAQIGGQAGVSAGEKDRAKRKRLS